MEEKNNFEEEFEEIPLEFRLKKKSHYNKIMFIVVVLFFLSYRKSRVFTVEKWMENPDRRVKIVDSLIDDHELVEMDRSEIIEILGEEGEKSGPFKTRNNLVYRLGPERAIMSIKDEWLVIELEDDKVKDFYIGLE